MFLLQILAFMCGNILIVASSLFYTVQVLHYINFNEWIVLNYEPVQKLLPSFLISLSNEYGISSVLLGFGLILIGLSYYLAKNQRPLTQSSSSK